MWDIATYPSFFYLVSEHEDKMLILSVLTIMFTDLISKFLGQFCLELESPVANLIMFGIKVA